MLEDNFMELKEKLYWLKTKQLLELAIIFVAKRFIKN